jgi:two-component system alkaline phosphatase synthesis response regulator PhoP
MAKDEAKQITEKILTYLKDASQGAHTSEIAKQIGYNRITVGKYLDILQAQGKIDVRKIGQAKVFMLSDEVKPKVLIVDDEPHVLNLVSLTLDDKKYEILKAEDGIQALTQVAQHKPDIIILDLMMPNMNGYEVCQKLKENVLTQHIPIIILSAKSEVKDRIKGMKIGADDYLTKPFDPLELEARIAAMLKREERYKHKHALTHLTDTVETQRNVVNWKKQHKGGGLIIKLEHMDGFFSVCGYKSGGEGISLLAKFIVDTVEEKGGMDDLVGHNAYDEIIIYSASTKQIQESIKKGFKAMLPYLYPGHTITSKGVSADGKTVPHLSLSFREVD